MPVPASVRVGTFTYAVRMDADVGRDLDGCHRRTKQRIDINPDQGPDALRDTVLHEVLHAVCDNAGLDSDDEDARKAEERFIQAITPSLLGVIRDNPALIAFLQERV